MLRVNSNIKIVPQNSFLNDSVITMISYCHMQ